MTQTSSVEERVRKWGRGPKPYPQRTVAYLLRTMGREAFFTDLSSIVRFTHDPDMLANAALMLWRAAPWPAAQWRSLERTILRRAGSEGDPARAGSLEALDLIQGMLPEKVRVIMRGLLSDSERVRDAAQGALSNLEVDAIGLIMTAFRDRRYWRRKVLFALLCELDRLLADAVASGLDGDALISGVEELALCYSGNEELISWKAMETLGPTHMGKLPALRNGAREALRRISRTAGDPYVRETAASFLTCYGRTNESQGSQSGPGSA